MKTDKATTDAFDKLLRPALEGLEFRDVLLKNCMHPEFLFRRGRTWFALSWDWRDRYLEVSLGHLFWFKDVMPRVVVIGDYSHWESTVMWDSIQSAADFEIVFGKISRSLPVAVSRLDAELPSILSEYKKARDRTTRIEDFIGPEATVESLEEFSA